MICPGHFPLLLLSGAGQGGCKEADRRQLQSALREMGAWEHVVLEPGTPGRQEGHGPAGTATMCDSRHCGPLEVRSHVGTGSALSHKWVCAARQHVMIG